MQTDSQEQLIYYATIGGSIYTYIYFLVVLSAIIGSIVFVSIFAMIYCCCLKKHLQTQLKPIPSSASSSNSSNLINNNKILSAAATTTTTTTAIVNEFSNVQKLQEICIIPINKPIISESKPQPLTIATNNSIENPSIMKLKNSKTLIERRGSNNSLTLPVDTLVLNKKRLSIVNTDLTTINNENLNKASNLLTLNELVKVSKQFQTLYNEFYNIPTNHPESILVYGSAIKNRYKTIIPNEQTRVNLPLSNNLDPLSSYINANYISGYNDNLKTFIATQGPMSNTIDDFWHMVWHENISCIVMITKLIECSKLKCDLYIPENIFETNKYGNYIITLNSISYENNEYEIRDLTIEFMNIKRTITHYWYTSWSDQNVPNNPQNIIEFINSIEAKNSTQQLPILIHCSAGIGRTGCYIAISNGIKQINNENMVDIVKIVSKMRQERGGLVQTLEQYEFIYQVLAYYCIKYKNLVYPSLPTKSPSFKSSSNVFTFDNIENFQY